MVRMIKHNIFKINIEKYSIKKSYSLILNECGEKNMKKNVFIKNILKLFASSSLPTADLVIIAGSNTDAHMSIGIGFSSI